PSYIDILTQHGLDQNNPHFIGDTQSHFQSFKEIICGTRPLDNALADENWQYFKELKNVGRVSTFLDRFAYDDSNIGSLRRYVDDNLASKASENSFALEIAGQLKRNVFVTDVQNRLPQRALFVATLVRRQQEWQAKQLPSNTKTREKLKRLPGVVDMLQTVYFPFASCFITNDDDYLLLAREVAAACTLRLHVLKYEQFKAAIGC